MEIRTSQPFARVLLATVLLSVAVLCLPKPASSEVVLASPSKPDLITDDDTGAFGTDDVTSNTKPRFRVVVPATGLLVELLEGDEVVGSVVAASRVATVQVDSAHELADGVHAICARVRTSALSTPGRLSEPALSVTIDTVAPAVPILDLPANEDSGSSSTDNVTNVGEWHIYGSLDDAFTVPTRETSPNGRKASYAAAPTWKFFPDNEGGTGRDGLQGTWTYEARGVDLAGNASDWSEALPIVFDSIAPATPSRPDLVDADDSGVPDDVTNVARPRFDVSVEDGALLMLFADDTQIEAGVDIADGEHAISAQAGDPAGNVSARSSSLALIIDTVKPAGTVQVNGGAASVRNTHVSVALAFADARGPSEHRISTDGGASWSAWQPYGEVTSATLAGADGVKTALAEVRDLAGNVGSASDDVILDRTGPAIRLDGQLAGAMLDVSNVVGFLYSTEDVSGVASSTAALDARVIANDSFVDGGVLLAGNHRIVITATDSLENTSTQTIVFTVHATIDGLIHEVDESVTGEAIDADMRDPLLTKLDAARSSIERGARTAARGQLGAFCNQLRAQAGKKVDAALAARLVNWTQDLSAGL